MFHAEEREGKRYSGWLTGQSRILLLRCGPREHKVHGPDLEPILWKLLQNFHSSADLKDQMRNPQGIYLPEASPSILSNFQIHCDIRCLIHSISRVHSIPVVEHLFSVVFLCSFAFFSEFCFHSTLLLLLHDTSAIRVSRLFTWSNHHFWLQQNHTPSSGWAPGFFADLINTTLRRL